ncbi:MAG TPA: transposase, partial [Thermoanaerobaculia bacterium]|nr:transposase [Thermoanaerobaculia bacterium]
MVLHHQRHISQAALPAEGSRRDALIALFDAVARQTRVTVHDWVVLSNHYHLMVETVAKSGVADFIRQVHSISAREWNALDRVAGRKVWFQYWDKTITYEKSYLARLNYIHQNPVHHRLVKRAEDYRWSSLRRFQEKAD